MDYDKFGIAIGDYVCLRGWVDETFPTLAEALSAVSEALLDGADRVRVYSVRYSERRQDYRVVDGPLVEVHADVTGIEAIIEEGGV